MALSRLLALTSTLTALLCASGCAKPWNNELPATSTLQPPRGFKLARTIIHIHSPISYDACDGKGMTDPTKAEACLTDLRYGFCANHVDFAFITDHVSRMAEYSIQELLQQRTGDVFIENSATNVANKITCPDGHGTITMTGYEDQLLPIGMSAHLDSDPETRATIYRTPSAATVTSLKNNANAVVFAPHTETRTVDELRTLGLDGMEIYNFHANMDPRYRHEWLGLDYFTGIVDMLVDWIDPYEEQQPDLAFLSFIAFSNVYFQKWNTLLAEGQKLTGIAACDSHQNALPWNDYNSERLDAHRRLIRWMPNHFLVHELTPTAIKAAIRQGRGWLVTEGLGSPVGMDFTATTGSTVANVGETTTLTPGTTYFTVALPALHAESPQAGGVSRVTIRLKKVGTNGTDQIVAESVNKPLFFAPTQTGAYRAEISILPRHLEPYINYKRDEYIREIPWIITNHIFLQ